ncbi:MAG: HlyD family efflux transporter periplasmic adaptor subunit [Muribaculaceae bacterium]|jgi:HlyD family secretion protein|nr:HlyD family efflux transporter periplasmic adaptor subunit [Muribaculaceae bacterium]
MDKEIPLSQRRARLRRKIIINGSIALVVVAAVAVGLTLSRAKVERSILSFAEVSTGRVETSLSASGKVVPAYEQIITSPIASRIVEVYASAGDSVAEGSPLLLLDLGSAETELSNLADQRAIKSLAAEKDAMADRTALADLEMRISIKEMAVSRLRAELEAERRLDSLGSGTGEKVAQAELAWNTGVLELDQLRRQLDSEKRIREAEGNSRRLDMSVFDKNMAEKQRQLDQARIRSPRSAILTSIISDIGRQISPGEKIATVADLSQFKIEGEIADSYVDRVVPGVNVIIRIGRSQPLTGRVTGVNPQSQGGVIHFTVALDDPSAPRLRPGLRTEVYVMTDLLDGTDVTRIPNGSYYTGAGETELWVLDPDGKSISRRTVTLGEGGYDFVEVTGGLKPGEQIVTSDMKDYRSKRTLSLK